MRQPHSCPAIHHRGGGKRLTSVDGSLAVTGSQEGLFTVYENLV